MEKFIANKSLSQNGSENNDLLSMLQSRHKRRLDNVKSDEEQEQKGSKEQKREQVQTAWENHQKKDTISTFEINLLQMKSNIEARNYVGWKMDGQGNRVYATFRNGKKIQASGQEAFLLALGDGKIKKKETTQKIEEYVPKENIENHAQPVKKSKQDISSFFHK
jgi:predicted proteasome-type protease